jgi:regulatory protein spx
LKKSRNSSENRQGRIEFPAVSLYDKSSKELTTALSLISARLCAIEMAVQFMIVVYTSPGCASCRKVKQWLKERNLPYIEKNIFTTLLNETEIRHLLMRSENGSEDIISKRSKIIQQNAIDLDDMTISELVHFIQENPSVLKRPIILNERNFQVGYDEEEIDAFVPQQLRSLARLSCNASCPNYAGCGKIREEA